MALDLFIAIHYFMAAFRSWIVNNLCVLLTICSSSSLLLIWKEVNMPSANSALLVWADLFPCCFESWKQSKSRITLQKVALGRNCYQPDLAQRLAWREVLLPAAQWMPRDGSKYWSLCLQVEQIIFRGTSCFFGTSKIRNWLPDGQKWYCLHVDWEALQRWCKGQRANLYC